MCLVLFVSPSQHEGTVFLPVASADIDQDPCVHLYTWMIMVTLVQLWIAIGPVIDLLILFLNCFFVLQSTWNTVWRWHIQTDNGVFWRVSKQATHCSICFKNVSSKWFVSTLFYAQKQLLLSAHLSHRNSVCLSVHLSVTRVDQSKTVQSKMTKSSSSDAWKTLVSETVNLFYKFEGDHPEW